MNNNAAEVIQKTNEPDVEGVDSTDSSGWGEYPLDSVFVRKDQRTVNEVIKRIKADRYILNPDFQRDFVWDVKKQSRLIESCLMRIPLPVFYVAEAKDGRIIVVDGLQRLTTFLRYMDNQFPLSKLGDGKEDAPQENPLLGKRFKDLSLTLQERLEDTQLTLYILDAKAPDRAKLDIFERVNSGEPLSRQQMRNCLFNGPATILLREMAENAEFIKATGSSLNRRSMRDREAINRFCAFRVLDVEQYRGDMDEFLAIALETMNKMTGEERDELTRDFVTSMRNNHDLFGRHAFRKSLLKDTTSDRSVINIALFDVCSVFLADIDGKTLDSNKKKLRSSIKALLADEEFIQAITYATNGRQQVKTRFSMMKKAVTEAIC